MEKETHQNRGHPNFSSAASDTSSAAGFGRGYYGGRRTYSDFEEHHYANTAQLRNGAPGSVGSSPFSDTNFSYTRHPPSAQPESILKNGTLPRANPRTRKPFMNGYGVHGNPELSNGGMHVGLNGGFNGGIIDNGLHGGIDNGLDGGGGNGSLDGLAVAADDEDNALTAYYGDEEDGATSPLLGNGTAIAMAAATGINGSATGAGAMEPDMMQGGNSVGEKCWLQFGFNDGFRLFYLCCLCRLCTYFSKSSQ